MEDIDEIDAALLWLLSYCQSYGVSLSEAKKLLAERLAALKPQISIASRPTYN